MTEKLDEQDLRRVSMVWPADLKEQVRGLVGSRGLTDFTLDAVRDKLRHLAQAGPSQPAEPETRPEPTQAPAPVPDLPKLPPGAAGTQEPGRAAPGQCPACLEELVNGECWTCPTR